MEEKVISFKSKRSQETSCRTSLKIWVSGGWALIGWNGEKGQCTQTEVTCAVALMDEAAGSVSVSCHSDWLGKQFANRGTVVHVFYCGEVRARRKFTGKGRVAIKLWDSMYVGCWGTRDPREGPKGRLEGTALTQDRTWLRQGRGS